MLCYELKMFSFGNAGRGNAGRGNGGRGFGSRSFDSDSEPEDNGPSPPTATTAVVAVPPSENNFSFGSPSTDAATTDAPQQQSGGFSLAVVPRTNPAGGFGSSNTSGLSGFGSTTTGSTFGGSTTQTGGFGSTTRGFGGFGQPAAAKPFATAADNNQVPRAAGAAQATFGFGSPQPAGGFGNPQPAGGFGAFGSFGAANNAGGNMFGAARANPFGNAFGLGFGKETPAIRHQRIRSSLFQFMSELSKESDCDDFSALLDECIAVTSAVKVSYYLRASFADIHFYNLGWSCKT